MPSVSIESTEWELSDEHPHAWIDITAKDAERSRVFYRDLLGGTRIVPAREILGLGKMAVLGDADGNRIGLWQS